MGTLYMAHFNNTDTLYDFQKLIQTVYAIPNDRQYSIWGLLVQQQRFTARALKGLRKEDTEKIRVNLLISVSWVASIANRLHFNMDDEVWRCFPGLCSYCGEQPCACEKFRPEKRKFIRSTRASRPNNLSSVQKMFESIYPAGKRTLVDAGLHLAEEAGEINEGVHNYMNKHRQKDFVEIKTEMADHVSCVCAVANSAEIDLAKELNEMYHNNCHACHQAPCICKFSGVMSIKT